MGNKDRGLSVITVVYNDKDGINKTIKSVASQMEKEDDYIIVDGNSTDGTKKIIDRNKNLIDNYISEDDEGPYDAMNKGIEKSKCGYVSILNSGDHYSKGAIKKVKKYINNEKKYDVIYGNIIKESGGKKMKTQKSFKKISKFKFGLGMPLNHPASFVKKSSYKKYGNFDTRYKISADYDLMYRFFKNGAKFKYLDEVITIMETEGLSSERFPENRKEEIYSLRKNDAPEYIVYMRILNLIKEVLVNCTSEIVRQ